jgi:glucose 1-dehydrogenase
VHQDLDDSLRDTMQHFAFRHGSGSRVCVMRLKDKVAVITGSDRGIGKFVALRFAQEGAAVVINYAHNQQAAEATAELVKQYGVSAAIVQADVSQVREAQHLIEEASSKFGRVDILVNNAGVEHNAPFWEVKEEDYDRVLGLNLKGAFFTSQAFVRLAMKAIEKSNAIDKNKIPDVKKIINMSSVHQDLPFPGFASYCAAKGGIRMLTRDLAIELGQLNITVNAIAPGAIATDINQKMMGNAEQMKNLLDQIPLHRMGKPEEVAGVAAFLASSDADYVTGSTYFIDGGLTWEYKEQEAKPKEAGAA